MSIFLEFWKWNPVSGLRCAPMGGVRRANLSVLQREMITQWAPAAPRSGT